MGRDESMSDCVRVLRTDTIKSIGESDKTNTLFLSHSPGAVREISDQVMQSMLIAERAKA
jgi:ABC-type glutathione transport system ATPase component